MSSFWIFSALLAASLSLSSGYVIDDDFGFEINDDLEVEFPPDLPRNKLWDSSGELTATVGRIFHLAVPKFVSSEDVKHFEAKLDQNRALPSWLLFDKTGGVFWGVPLAEDVGVLHISVKAVHKENTDTETFTLRVNDDKTSVLDSSVDKCPPSEDSTILTLIIDKAINAIKPKQRVIAINNVAKFFALPYNAFCLKPELQPDDISDSSVILAGPGNLKTRTSKLSSFIQTTVGCEGRLWLNSAPIVHQLKQQARDGTITEVLRLPLVGWRVKTETQSVIREKREKKPDKKPDDAGSGDDVYDEYEYDYEDYDNPDEDPREHKITSASTPKTTKSTRVHHVTTSSTTTVTVANTTHPHRHHHGEIKPEVPELPNETSPVTMASTTSSTTEATAITDDETEPDEVTPVSGIYKPSETLHSDDEYDDEYDDNNDEDDDESSTDIPLTRGEILPVNKHNVTAAVTTTTTTHKTTEDLITLPQPTLTSPTTTSSTTTSTTTTTTTLAPTTTTSATTTTTPPPITTTSTTVSTTTTEDEPVVLLTNTTTELTTTASTTTSTTTTSTTTTTTAKTTTLEDYEEETVSTAKHTTARHVTGPPLVTESVEYEVKIFAPTVKIRLNRIAITVGKMFSQIVPEKMFEDTEDENNLTLEFLDKNGVPVKNSSWCQFNPQTREIYGLPLGDDISGWEYILKATDKEGASVSEKVEIVVQQHKYWRVVNHEFLLYARVEKKHEFNYPVDWALHILRGINSIFSASNASKITVRSVDYNTDPIVFTWTNDTLATNNCPLTEINELFGVLTANDNGDPSIALSRSIAPELRAKKVTQHRLGVCEETEAPQPPLPPPLTPPSNLAPILRNEVNHINATIGELLVFRVPDDTFYDPEELSPRDLTLELNTVDMKPIPLDNWLQFDTNNKEFYGIPSSRDAKRVSYQLICKDSGGLYAVDALIVQIHPATKLNYTVEFNVTIEVNYETFSRSADLKRKFVNKLRDLLGDSDTRNIVIHKISRDFPKDFATVTWFNKTLVRDKKCPWEEIKRITGVFVNAEHTIMSDVQDTMGPEFPVSAFSSGYMGVCQIQPVLPPRVETVPTLDESNTAQESSSEYLITFIVPAVIITVMLLLAAIAACVLYRKRRSGKMNIEEDGRQSYGNKGIPVIFQEELDEKPESGTKAPIILKDEKPPLAPPEYSKSGSLNMGDDSEPYQPPPPFTRAQDGRQARPKPAATPTYRKPPPYVPP